MRIIPYLLLSLLLPLASRPAAAQSAAAARLQARARAIHEQVFVVDSHEDTPGHLVQPGFDLTADHETPEAGQVDFPKMRRGGLDAAFWAVYVGQGPRTPAGYAAAQKGRG